MKLAIQLRFHAGPPSPRNPDQGPEPTNYPRMDGDALKRLLLRVTGFDGRAAQKLENTEIHRDDQPDDEDDAEDVEGC